MRRNSRHVLTEWLVLGAQRADATALEQLLKLWYPEFLRYSTRQLRNRDAAKDAVQDAMLTMARTIGRLKDPAAFPKWAYRILHRRGIDILRKDMRLRSHETGGLDADSTPDSATLAAGDDLGVSLGQALNGLEELSYNVIHLYYLHGLSIKEIASVCAIPAGTVKSRLHTARARLKKILEDNA